MALRFPQIETRPSSGGSDAWDDGAAGWIFTREFFPPSEPGATRLASAAGWPDTSGRTAVAPSTGSRVASA